MKKNTFGFTFVELLIVLTIITVIGIFSFSSFSKMSDVQDTETIMKVIKNTLESFDKTILNHEITSYETVFKTGSLGFITNLDWHKKTFPMKYSFDFDAGTGVVTSTDINAGIWELSFSTYDALPKIYTLSANGGTQIFSFPQNLQKRWYKIFGVIRDVDLNSFEIQYYSLMNNSSENEVRLMSISGSISEGNEQLYSSLIVQNVLGKKILQGSGITTIDTLEKATLSFEKNGKELHLLIYP